MKGFFTFQYYFKIKLWGMSMNILFLGVMHDVFLSKAIMANKYTRSLILLVGWRKKNKSLDSFLKIILYQITD